MRSSVFTQTKFLRGGVITLAWVVALATASACATTKSFVWVDDLSHEDMAVDSYRLQPGDALEVLVWNQPKLSVNVKVRPDGNVTLPLVGDVASGGLTPSGAAQAIERRLTGLVVEPKVTVTLTETRESSISIVGEVRNPGRYNLRSGDGVLQALATAGGLTQFADNEQIYVVRSQPDLVRIRFNYASLTHAEGNAIMFQLRDGDVLVIE